MAADLEPRLLEMLRKNFSKRPEDRLAPGELDVLRAVRSSVGPETWLQYEQAGRAAERARRKAEREVQLLFAALVGGGDAAPRPAAESGATSGAASNGAPALSAQLHVFLTHHALRQLRLEQPRAGGDGGVHAAAGPLLRKWAPLHAALRADVDALTLRPVADDGAATLVLPLAGMELALGGGSSGDDAALAVAPSPFMFRLLQRHTVSSGSKRDGSTGSSSSPQSPSPVMAVLAAVSWPQLNEWVQALTEATASRAATPSSAPAATPAADGSAASQPTASRRWWAATPSPLPAAVTTTLASDHAPGASAPDAPAPAAAASRGPRLRPAGSALPPRKRYSDIMAPTGGTNSSSSSSSGTGSWSWQAQLVAAGVIPPQQAVAAPPAGDAPAPAQALAATATPRPGGAGAYAHAAAAAAAASSSSSAAAAGTSAHGRRPSATATTSSSNGSSTAPRRGNGGTPAPAPASLGLPPATGMKQMAAAVAAARAVRDGSVVSGSTTGDAVAAAPSIATSPAAASALAVTTSPRLRSRSTRLTLSFSPPTPPRRASRASALDDGGFGFGGSEDVDPMDGERTAEGTAESAPSGGGFGSAPPSAVAASSAARTARRPAQAPPSATARSSSLQTRPLSAGSIGSGTRGMSLQRRAPGTAGGITGGAFVRADVARRSASPAPRSATASGSGGGSGGPAAIALRASAAVNVSHASSVAMSVDGAGGGVAAALNFSRASAASNGTRVPSLPPRAAPPAPLPSSADIVSAVLRSPDHVSAGLSSVAAVARAIVAGGGTLSPPSQPPSPATAEAPASASVPPSAPPSPPDGGAGTARLRAERDALRARAEQLTAALELAHGAVGALEADRQAQADALASLQAAATAQAAGAADVGARAAALQASVADLRSSLTMLRAGVAASFGGVRGWLAAAAEGMQALQAATAAAAAAAADATAASRRAAESQPSRASAGSGRDDDDDFADAAALAASALQLAGMVGMGASRRAAPAAAAAQTIPAPVTAAPTSGAGGLLATLRTHGALVSLPPDTPTDSLRRRVADAVRAAASAEGCALVLVSSPADAERACDVVLGSGGSGDVGSNRRPHLSLLESALVSAHTALLRAAPSREVQLTVTAVVLVSVPQGPSDDDGVDVHVFDVFAPSEDALAVVPLRGNDGDGAYISAALQCRHLAPCSGPTAHPRAVPADASALVLPLAADDPATQAAQLAALLRGGVRASLLQRDAASFAATVVVTVDLDWVEDDAATARAARLLLVATDEPLATDSAVAGASITHALAAAIDGVGADTQQRTRAHPLTQLLAATVTDEGVPQRLSRVPTAHVVAALLPPTAPSE